MLSASLRYRVLQDKLHRSTFSARKHSLAIHGNKRRGHFFFFYYQCQQSPQILDSEVVVYKVVASLNHSKIRFSKALIYKTIRCDEFLISIRYTRKTVALQQFPKILILAEDCFASEFKIFYFQQKIPKLNSTLESNVEGNTCAPQTPEEKLFHSALQLSFMQTLLINCHCS